MVLLIFSLLQGACSIVGYPLEVPEQVNGMRPIYITIAEAQRIEVTPAQPIVDAGSFLVLGDTLYIVEALQGVHVFDNSDPNAPINVAFISIPGCNSVTAIGNFLYVNNYRDLVTLDVSDLSNLRVVDREPNLYSELPDFPPNYSGYFDCYDDSRGLLGGWETAELTEPQCFINFF